MNRNQNESSSSTRKRKQRFIGSRKKQQRIRDVRKRVRLATMPSEPAISSLNVQDEPHHSTGPIGLPGHQPEKIREDCLRNITQFRAEPDGQSAYERNVIQEMSRIRQQIKHDLSNHDAAINPAYFIICQSCGHSIPKTESHSPTSAIYQRWLEFLQFKTFTLGEDTDRKSFCRTCTNSLRRQVTPYGSICRGWPFDQELPTELSILTRHDRLLICLRLPCVYVSRSQGGFGQYCCRGPPVSFSNPVSEVATKLPRYASKVFHMFLDTGQTIRIDTTRICNALSWLQRNNPLYKDITVDENALIDVGQVQELSSQPHAPPNAIEQSPNEDSIENEERSRGTQGPLDIEGLRQLAGHVTTGIEDADNTYHAQLLIKHILRPFTYRRNSIIPSHDATEHLESYFPVLFPYGKGGPKSIGCQLGRWMKHVLAVHNSRFAADFDFIFFVYSVLKRKRLTRLATYAPIRQISTNSILEVRQMLSSSLPSEAISSRIDMLLRSGALNASFETLQGSPAFWARLKRTS